MNGASRDFGFWCSFLARTWGGERLGLVDVILDAGRWAQADLFLAARTSANPAMPYFYCNAYPLDYHIPVCWSYWSSDQEEADDPAEGAVPLMIAEMKFLHGGYGPGAFAGDKVPPVQFAVNCGEFDMLIGPGHPSLKSGRLANLLDSYHRLLHYHHLADPLRVLVLMLDTPLQGITVRSPGSWALWQGL